MNHSRPPLKTLTIAIHLAVVGGSLFSANALANDEWVIEHPNIFTNPKNQELAETFIDTSDDPADPDDGPDENGNYPPILGDDKRPLLILYNPDRINTVTNNTGDQLILKTNIFSFGGEAAIQVDDELDGIVNDNKTIWSFSKQTQVIDPEKAGIYVEAARTKITTTTTTATSILVKNQKTDANGLVVDGDGNPVYDDPVVTEETPVSTSVVTYESGTVSAGNDPDDEETIEIDGEDTATVTTTTTIVSVDTTTETTSGRLTGSIINTGNIKGGIYIAGEATPTSGAVYNSYGEDNSVAESGTQGDPDYQPPIASTGTATLEGGFSVINGGTAETVNAHVLDIKNHAYVDFVVAGENSSIKAKGNDSNTIHIAEGGVLGGASTFTHGIDTLHTIDYIPITGTNDNGTPGDNSDDFDNAVANVDSDGYRRIGDEDDLEGNDSADLYVNVDLNNDGLPDDSDEATENDNVAASGNNPAVINKPDLYKVAEQQLPSDVSGTVTRNESDTVIFVEGTIESELGNAVRVEGTATGKILVTAGGQLKGSLDVAAGYSANYHKAAIAIGRLNDGAGTYNGTIANQGTIDGGVFVVGTHNSAGSLYHSLGTGSTPAKMNGGYHIVNGGQATATTGNAIHLDWYSSTDEVVVEGVEDRALSNDDRGKLISTAGHAIYIEQSADLGGTFYSGSFTDPVITVKDEGVLEASDSTKEAIVVKGNLNGYVHADNGTITGGIHVGSTGVMGSLGTLADDDYSLLLENGSKLGQTGTSVLKVEGRLNGRVEVTGSGSWISGGGGDEEALIYISPTGVFGGSSFSDKTALLIKDNGWLYPGTNSVKSEGYFNGAIEVDNGKIFSDNNNAVDFSASKTPLLFRQIGSDASTGGSIIGSATLLNDKVEILDGTLSGGTLTNIDELLISTNATVTLNDEFTFPVKTTIQIEEGFDATGQNIITVNEAVNDNVKAVADSQLNFKPANLAAYRELAAGSTTITVINTTGTIEALTHEKLTTATEGITTDWVSSASALLSVTNADVSLDNKSLTVTLAATNPNQYVNTLIGGSLSETETTLDNLPAPSATQQMTQAVSALASAQSGDPAKAEALFNALNSTTDFNQLASELAQPTEITGRAGLGAMNTTQGITLSEARGQAYGFSYGDGFNLGELWGQAIYSKSDQAMVSGTAGYQGKTNGYIFGAGLSLSDDWLFGLSGAMTTTTINGDQGANLKVSSYISSLYSHWDNDDWFFDSLLTLGLSKNDTRKTISLQRVEADYDSILWGGRFIAGHHFNLGHWQLSPQMELNYGHVSFEKYTERGNSGWEKTVKASDYEIMEMGGGFRANHSFSWAGGSFLADGAIRPELSVMGYYDIKKTGSQFEATYLAGGEPFVVTEAERDRFRIQSALGVSVDILDSWTLNAAYNLNWSDHYKAHSFSAKARYEF